MLAKVFGIQIEKFLQTYIFHKKLIIVLLQKGCNNKHIKFKRQFIELRTINSIETIILKMNIMCSLKMKSRQGNLLQMQKGTVLVRTRLYMDASNA